jgi:hypothetical protein
VELALSISISYTAFWLLRLILPYDDDAVAAAVATMSALWLVHVTLRAIKLLADASRENRRRTEMANDLKIPLDEFQSKMNRDKSSCSCQVEEADAAHNDGDASTDAKNLIRQSAMECSGKTTKFSISPLAILGTVVLQCSIRLLVLLHSINRTIRAKRQSSRTNSPRISFFDVPFTIGKNMSLGGRSFFIFYFLDRWLDQNDDNLAFEGSRVLQGVSLDQISINSSHILVGKSSKGSSRCGLSFGIEFRLAIHLRDFALTPTVRSIVLSIRIESLEFALFPSQHLVKACGLKCEGKIDFNTASIHTSDPTNIIMETHKLLGIGMVHECTEISSHKAGGDTIVSWDSLQSAFYLQQLKLANNSSQSKQKKVVSTVSLPAGNVVIHASQLPSQNHIMSTNSPSQRLASVVVGKATDTSGDRNHFCRNRFAVGLELEMIPSFIRAIQWILRDLTSSIHATSATNQTTKSHKEQKKSKNNSSIGIDAVDASFCSCFYVPCCNRSSEALYLTTSHTSLCWRKATQMATGRSAVSDALKSMNPSHGDENSYNSPLHTIRITGAALQYFNTSFVNILHLDKVIAKLYHLPSLEKSCSKKFKENGSFEQYILANTGHLLVRIDDRTIKQLAGLNIRIIDAANDLKSITHQLKRKSRPTNDDTSQLSASNKNDISRFFDRMKIASSSVDAVVELQPPRHDFDNERYPDNPRIRVAFLQRKTLIQVRYIDSDVAHSGEQETELPAPNKLFASELQRHNSVCLTDANISRLEFSVTFYPHAALPVVQKHTAAEKETTFYGQVQELNLLLASPPQSQIIYASANKLHAYELFADKGMAQSFSIPVHECLNFDISTVQNSAEWLMLLEYKKNHNVLVADILGGTCKFCRIERNDRVLSEKVELMSIQLSKGPSELQIYWSPVLQWLQASFNERIQTAIDYFKSSLSNSPPTKCGYNTRKTQIHFMIDPNTNATFFASLGKKSRMSAVIESGMDVNMSVTKRQNAGTSNEMKGMKPNVYIKLSRILISFNEIKTHTFVFGGICFENFIKRATSDEVLEYVQMKGTAICDLDDELVTDWDGYTMKEVFDLKVDSCIAKFHPCLLFGEVIGECF